ncbi:hypothetical protein KSF78_0008492 [Schistosoma japonicum]|nr:hypothetical protein KSF78_0008492 [Schistosoma japonicum]KAH8874746.1 hypothetical protein KSF78_0008492 [Schistosoma japonicum]
MNHAIASENRTINKYKDCQSEHFKAKNGLNFLQYGQAFLLDIKATYDKPTINQLQGLESCLDAQHQDFLRMESENSEEYCNTLGTPFSIDIDAINNAIDDSQYYTYLYNINLFEHQILLDIYNEFKKTD